ncbi:MAG: GGDEF domain-containing protein, partial [Methylobacteriaceae bacterium]|nr:GGDEF domain-containing protein [Methylobacteriaceae bacterium]
ADNVADLEPIAAGEKPSVASQRFFDQTEQVGRVFRYQIFDPQGALRLAGEDAKSGDTDDDEEEEEGEGGRNSSAVRAVVEGRPIVFARERTGPGPGWPPFYAEAYLPVIVKGKTIAVVEAYVDQTEKRDEYRKTFAIASGSLCLLMGLAFGIPTVAWHRRTSEKERADARIDFLAHHDALTGLPNRNCLAETLNKTLSEMPAPEGSVAMHHVDLDRFKDINDTLGHDFGDKVITAIAKRLADLVAPTAGVVARLGGDEFAVVHAAPIRTLDAGAMAQRIADAVSKPLMLDGPEITVAASVGVAVAPADGATSARLMKSAGLALQKCKAEGRNCIRLFAPEMDAELDARLRIERMIRDAILNDGFELHFQPTVEMPDRRLVGFEALLRLRASDGANISPARFVPIAEEMGLIGRIGAWVLGEACRAAALWPQHLKVAVNLSPAQFAERDLSDIVRDALAKASLEPHRLELEITEGLLLRDTDAVMDELGKLKGLGVAIVMDDFGTGYSSLSYLWRFPFDKIKIDRSFMQAMEADEGGSAATVVKTIIGLGRSLNMTVTVEGVESDRQVAFAGTAECDEIQGFYFGRPMPMTDVAAHIVEELKHSLPYQHELAEEEPAMRGRAGKA